MAQKNVGVHVDVIGNKVSRGVGHREVRSSRMLGLKTYGRVGVVGMEIER